MAVLGEDQAIQPQHIMPSQYEVQQVSERG